MARTAEWTVDNPAVWRERVNGQTIMLRHSSYPAEATWDGHDPAELLGIAADYLRKVSGAFGLPDLFDRGADFSPKVGLTWLPVVVESPPPHASFLLSRYGQPLTRSDLLDRTAILLAVESAAANDPARALGSRLGIKIVAHISNLSTNNVRITGASCSTGLPEALGPLRDGPFSSQVAGFFASFFTELDFRDRLKRQILESSGLTGSLWFEGIRIRRHDADGVSIDVFANVPSPEGDPNGAAQWLTSTIALDGTPFSVITVETFPLVTGAAPVTARLFPIDPASQRRVRHVVSARPSRAPRRLKRFRHLETLPGLTPVGGIVPLLDDLNQVEVMRSRLVHPGANESLPVDVPYPISVRHARTNRFAALSGYRRARYLFDTMRTYGLLPEDYFKLAALPLRIRYRAPITPGPGKDGKTINAQVSYDPPGAHLVAVPWDPHTLKPLQVRFALGDLRRSWSRRQPLGLTADPRWSWHEYSHVLLAASTGALELLFVHSTGDALAAIMGDPRSRIFRGDPAPNQWVRGYTFPWAYLHRRHDRSVYNGWSWSGRFHRPARFPHIISNYRHKGYQSEQILSTSLFRLYRALGGDTVRKTGRPAVQARRAAADYCAYLIMRAIGQLPPAALVPLETPDQLVTTLIDADIATWPAPPGPLAERVGGWAQKVVRWAFEAQGLYATTDPLAVIDAPGKPPDVDVFIDNGRPDSEGDFPRGGYAPVSLDLHTAPWQATASAVDVQANQVTVRVRNRGATDAANTVAQVWWIAWPDGGPPPKWDATTWTSLGGPSAPKTVPAWPSNPPTPFGPFPGLPAAPSGDRLLILAAATCPADRANNDPSTGYPCALVPTRIVDLVAGDNNLGLRIYRIP